MPTGASSLVGQCAAMRVAVSAASSDSRCKMDLPPSFDSPEAALEAGSQVQVTLQKACLPSGGWIVCAPAIGASEHASALSVVAGSHPDSSGGAGLAQQDVIAVLRVAFAARPTQQQLDAVQAVASEGGHLLARQRDLKEAE